MAKNVPQVDLTTAQVEMIQAWESLRKQIEDLKSRELLLRMEIIRTVPFTDKEEGGQTVKLGGGWRLALDKPVDYKMDTKNNDAVGVALVALHAKRELAVLDLFRWEPVMSVGAYKKLSDEEKLILAPVVTSKPGTPTLALVPPTEKKA